MSLTAKSNLWKGGQILQFQIEGGFEFPMKML